MTVFTKIINGDIPCYKIAEDENDFPFLDIGPFNLVDTLGVNKLEDNLYLYIQRSSLF